MTEATIGGLSATVAQGPQSRFRRFLSDFTESRLAVIGFFVFVLVLLLALFGPWITPQNPFDLTQLDIFDVRLRPGAVSEGSGMAYWLGTDPQGRDMLSAIVYGLRTSVFVGGFSAVVSLVIGAAIGLTAAYFGGRVDSILMRLVDLQLSFPAILVALILLSILGQGADKVLIALVIVQWAYYARTARGAALVERNKEYVDAATCLALGHRRILFHHIAPNCMPPLIVIVTIQVADAIALEASLSFLGVGMPVTEPSLGLLIATGFDYLLSGSYWISLFPGVALAVTIVAINLVGDQLRDVLNPRLQR